MAQIRLLWTGTDANGPDAGRLDIKYPCEREWVRHSPGLEVLRRKVDTTPKIDATSRTHLGVPLPGEEGTTQKVLRTCTWEPRPEFGLDCLTCASSARQRWALIEERLLRRNVKQFRGGLLFRAHRFLFHSSLGSIVITKKGSWALSPARLV